MRCKHSGRQQIKIGLSTILSVWFNLELQIFSEWLFISSTGGFNVKVGVKKTAWKRNQGNIVVVFFRLLQRKDLVLCVCPTCVSLNHHYLMCTNGYHFTFICYTLCVFSIHISNFCRLGSVRFKFYTFRIKAKSEIYQICFLYLSVT